MPEKTIYAAIGAGAAATFAFLKGNHSSKKEHKARDKRMSQMERDIRACFGTNRESYVEKGFCSLQSKTLEDKVNNVETDTKALREAQSKIRDMLHDVHSAVCNRKQNERQNDDT